MTYREHRPTQRYIDLMNERYDVLRSHAHDGQVELLYDGTWVAQLAVRATGPLRWVAGEGVTMELALAALERELGIPKWSG
ncbi:hypothetical protein [Kineosporia succinea]|uniref:Uncharacterized protein n=1 Tax=Kineosporia succinea TaxID=84632 RepID=A0ABT9PEN9_9ACTN|nr:hypothetical protein [Kineosporia succinea]MDP9831171.1 hypothetical protein [Kineosporia succinea]